MGKDPFGIMLRRSRVFACIVMVGWVTAATASSALKLPVAGLPGSQCDTFSPAILNSLGQKALGLSVQQIENCIPGSILASSLPSLSKVQGWDPEQAGAILEKLFSSGYQIQDGQSLAALGSLVVGLNHTSLESIPAQVVLDAVKVPSFAKQLETMPPTLKTAFVEKLVAATAGFNDLVKYTPDGLVPYIPKSLLVPGDTFNIQDLNDKPWTPEQAAMLFPDIIKRDPEINSLSPSILQGVTCAVAANMDDERFQQLLSVLGQKNVQLSEEQLSCLAKRVLLSGPPEDLNNYPKDLFLFLRPSDPAAGENCKEYVTRVGKANIDVLEKDSPQRKQLLSEALACLDIHGLQVTKEDAAILGHLVCDLGADYITASGNNFLTQLNQCKSFTPEQIKAIQALLSSGGTSFGLPSTWSTSTLEELSGLLHIFDHSILQNIPSNVLKPWLKDFLHRSHMPTEQLASIVKNLYPSRQKRSSGCPAEKTITQEVLDDELMPLYYDNEELRQCLDDPTLLANLNKISAYAFTEQQLMVIKEKLDRIYPTGYPDSVVRSMGSLLSLMTPEDVKKWKFNSPDTLVTLLDNAPNDEVAREIIQQYGKSGGLFDATALDAVGGRYICSLTQGQLKTITENAIKNAKTLNIGGCPQTTKDILYPKAKRAYSDRHNEFPAYYNLIKPYLGGAPGEDLRALSKNNVNMDINTFKGLRKDAVLELTPNDVRHLLGINLAELKTQQNDPFIRDWIVKQKQSELDGLGLGLRGGIPNGYIVVPPEEKNRKKRGVFAFEGF
ncbi:mesothelin-like [Lacerta agilis]|uniref:mesothelin-like n=1 Tax=Lacerta agilis TaxID=80427 RepID=UPI0014199312|nr:mesothelin-like [Lacerta agilis]